MVVNIGIPCSDKPGKHDFNLLKKLVLSDGSTLRAKLPGRPTRDCLFSDPARDGKRWRRNYYESINVATLAFGLMLIAIFLTFTAS